MQTDAVWAATWGENEKKAQCFYYAVISAVRREAPLRRELSTPWIPEGRDHTSLMRFWNDMCQFKWTVFHSTERAKTKLGVSEDRFPPLSSPSNLFMFLLCFWMVLKSGDILHRSSGLISLPPPSVFRESSLSSSAGPEGVLCPAGGWEGRWGIRTRRCVCHYYYYYYAEGHTLQAVLVLSFLFSP